MPTDSPLRSRLRAALLEARRAHACSIPERAAAARQAAGRLTRLRDEETSG